MYKVKRKILAAMLAMLMVLQMIPATFAEEIFSINDHIRGKVIEFSADATNSVSANDTIISYEENQDGSITVYQYKNGELIEAHTTIPGSLVVHHEYYEENHVRQNVEYIDINNNEEEDSVSRLTSTDSPDYVNNRPLGYMHYNNGIIPVISIYCHVEEEGYNNKQFTLNAGTAKTLAEWAAWVMAQMVVMGSTAGVVAKFVTKWVVRNVLEETVGGMYMALITKTIDCTYYNQHIYGECTSHSGKNEGLLEGTYIYYDGEIITEGYTTRMWGQDALGRMMFYKVIGVEYIPTSWTNVDV